ncbi:MAG: hypothetical protein M5U28_52870 [Sandaracinaceae bacterium]|nr:hypothetical protein [Sandaracinaceae bacterium]
MPNGDEQILASVRSYLENCKLSFDEREEQHCTKITVRSGALKNHLNVYNSGKIVVGGSPKGDLWTLLNDVKTKIEQGQPLLANLLPFDISSWPTVIRGRVPDVDDVIVSFVQEALKCYGADALLSCAFMLGAASEMAMCNLISSYGNAISDPTKQERFRSKTNGRMISRQFEEFTQSWKSAKTKPTDADVGNDLETIIGSMFQFCRITRNEVGHPHAVPNLDKGALLADLGHFVTYLERIYRMKRFYENNPVEV